MKKTNTTSFSLSYTMYRLVVEDVNGSAGVISAPGDLLLGAVVAPDVHLWIGDIEVGKATQFDRVPHMVLITGVEFPTQQESMDRVTRIQAMLAPPFHPDLGPDLTESDYDSDATELAEPPRASKPPAAPPKLTKEAPETLQQVFRNIAQGARLQSKRPRKKRDFYEPAKPQPKQAKRAKSHK
jgi:hypothetical protein